MKKILILLLLAASMTAQAQFTVGINTSPRPICFWATA